MSKMMYTPQCAKCGERRPFGNDKNGIPNMVGFQLDDGRVLNLCSKCMSDMGRCAESGDMDEWNAFLDKWR